MEGPREAPRIWLYRLTIEWYGYGHKRRVGRACKLEKDSAEGSLADSQLEIQNHTWLLQTDEIRTQTGVGSLLKVRDIVDCDPVGRGLAGL